MHKVTKKKKQLAYFTYSAQYISLILSESTQNMHHFGASPITTVFSLEEIWVIEFYPDLRLSQLLSTSKLDYSKSVWGVMHQQCGDHHKVHEKGFIMEQVLSQ